MLCAYDATTHYTDQGGNKHPGAIMIYLEPWQDDIFDFINLMGNHRKEARTHYLFYTLIPDLL